MIERCSKATNQKSARPRLRRQRSHSVSVLRLALSVLAVLAVPTTPGGKSVLAQANAPLSTKPIQQQDATAQPSQLRRRAGAHPHATSIQYMLAPDAMATPPLAPPVPVWPANQPLREARVTWNSRGLEIEANNSSLVDILHQVLAETGAELQGLARDQRIFGTYGPGPPGDVLSTLLDDFGYNVLMIGGQDADVPRKIVLSIRQPANPEEARNDRNRGNPDDDKADPLPEPAHPLQMVTPFGNGDSGKPETPQQIMQDILSRQQKIDQRSQQDGQQDNPQP